MLLYFLFIELSDQQSIYRTSSFANGIIPTRTSQLADFPIKISQNRIVAAVTDNPQGFYVWHTVLTISLVESLQVVLILRQHMIQDITTNATSAV